MYKTVKDSLFDAAERGIGLGIATDGRTGPQWLAIAELFRHEKGIAFAEPGWPGAPDKSFHVVEGTIDPAPSGNGWIVGNSWVFPLHPRARLMADFAAWAIYRTTPEGRKMTRAVCRRTMESRGIFDEYLRHPTPYPAANASLASVPALQP